MASQLSAPPGGDHNRAGELNAVAWTWAAVASVFVALRVYSRTKLTYNMWWDDWFIILTLVLGIIFNGLWTWLGALGGCRHLYYLQQDPAQAVRASRVSWITQPFVIMALATGKVSVAFLIIRIMGKSFWRRIFLIYCAMILSFVFCSVAIILTYSQCRPVSALWDPSLVEKGLATCWPPSRQADFSVFTGSWLAFVDLAMALMPVTILWNLQMRMWQKVAIGGLLGLGVFACVCGAIKTSKLLTLTARSDITYITVTLWIWNANEVYIVIIAACVPTFPPIYHLISARLRGVEGKGSSQKPSHLSSYYYRKKHGYPPGSGSNNKRTIPLSVQSQQSGTAAPAYAPPLGGGGGVGSGAEVGAEAYEGDEDSYPMGTMTKGVRSMSQPTTNTNNTRPRGNGNEVWLELGPDQRRSAVGGAAVGAAGGNDKTDIRRTVEVDVDVEENVRHQRQHHHQGEHQHSQAQARMMR